MGNRLAALSSALRRHRRHDRERVARPPVPGTGRPPAGEQRDCFDPTTDVVRRRGPDRATPHRADSSRGDGFTLPTLRRVTIASIAMVATGLMPTQLRPAVAFVAPIADEEIRYTVAPYDGGNSELRAVRSNGLDDRLLVPGIPYSVALPNISPDRTKLYFRRTFGAYGTGDAYIHATAADGSSEETIPIWVDEFDLSPDGLRIVRKADGPKHPVDGQNHQYLAFQRLDGTGLVPVLFDEPGEVFGPKWAGSDSVVFTFQKANVAACGGGGERWIARYDLTTQILTKLTPDDCGALNSSPDVSPVDGRIAWQSHYGEISIMALDGSDSHVAAVNSGPFGEIRNPSWSPDGTRFAAATTVYSASQRADRFRLAVFDASSGAMLTLLAEVGQVEYVDWASARPLTRDSVPPIVAGIASRPPDANGWYRGPVTIEWSATDPAPSSGVPSTPTPTVAAAEGRELVYRSAPSCDPAGNCASGAMSLSIDLTPPNISIAGVANDGVYEIGTVLTPSCTASDLLSGLDGDCSMAGASSNGQVGTQEYVATARDMAGNVATSVVRFTFAYPWAGFLQPINDPSLSPESRTSVFRAGSTVPVKFKLTRLDGTVVTPLDAPQWTAPERGGPTTLPAEETAYADPATAGSSYRYDPASEQWIFNWQTEREQGGYYWRLGVRLDDGMTHFVIVGLR